MDNFTNKNKIKEKWDFQKVHELSCALPYSKQPLKDIINQDNATEHLLMISEQDTQKMKIMSENIRSEIDLTPWSSVNIKLNCQKKQSNSKTNLVLPVCENTNRITQSNKQNTQITEDSDNRVIFISTQHKKCRKRKKKFRYQIAQGVEDKENIVSKCQIVIVKRKNSQKQSKNSHSTFARYSDHASQWSSTISTHNPNSLCKYDSKKYKSDIQNKTQTQDISKKRISGMFIQAKKYSKTNRQNEPMELYGRLVPKLQNINPRSSTTNTNNTKFIKCVNNNGASATNPLVRKNTSVLNELHNRGVNQFHQYMDYVRMERKKKTEDLEERKQVSSFMKNQIFTDYQSTEKNTEQQKYPNEYQKLKREIVSNIQKESIIKISLPTNEKNSKKILGKYLKQNLIKRERDITKAQILDEAYPSNNPITKHLYDRYKKLLNKKK